MSHSGRDKAFVLEVSHALTKIGVDVFLDNWELEAGDPLHRSLNVALEKSRFIGVVISPDFVRSEWCMDELAAALAREKRTKSKVVIPIICKKAPAIPLLEDRIYIDFSKDIFGALCKLGQVIHGLGVSCISEQMAKSPPQGLGDVAQILEQCGWDNSVVMAAEIFDDLVARLTKLRIPYATLRAGVISIAIEDVERVGGKAETILAEVWSARQQNLFGTIRKLDPAAAETVQFLLLLCLNEGVAIEDIAEALSISKTTVVRWRNGSVLPSPMIRRSIVKTLISRIEESRRNDMPQPARIQAIR
jgi:DNA-binding XRE family transcriptional regulator